MKVDLAFQLFGDQVIKGIFLHKEKINSVYRTVQPTEEFLLRFNRLIRVMTSRTSDTALRPKRGNQQFLEEFLNHLDAWEECTKTIGVKRVKQKLKLAHEVSGDADIFDATAVELAPSRPSQRIRTTAKCHQHPLKRFSGKTRQAACDNDHPHMPTFLQLYRMLSAYSLLAPPLFENREVIGEKPALGLSKFHKTFQKADSDSWHLEQLKANGPSGAKCVHEAIVEELKRKLDLQQKQTKKLEKQLEAVLGNKLPHLAPDQAMNAGHPDPRGNRWSDKTVQKALHVALEGDSVDGTFLKHLVFQAIKKSEAAGCHVDAVISDMGSGNKALWKCCGISATRAAEPVLTATGSATSLPMLPPVLKNVRGHLVKGQTISLSKETVDKYKLPTEKVSVEHIKRLVEEDQKRDLKLAPHLKAAYLELNHFDKMSVSSAVVVLNHSVGAAMQVLVKMELLPVDAVTTALVYADDVPLHWHGNEPIQGDLAQRSCSVS
ncbi:hypothetical protein HPB48_016225 [Haemaphysalis longicornis]|uniref:Uncharacterized protein n=1 Tax=Haemaphysalis longicornis TaxID=44386 RepID=A0A9J6GJ45_HAELO|nr:hypothetical protein HPB48_016225 [Haemaphysalis longicornis]